MFITLTSAVDPTKKIYIKPDSITNVFIDVDEFEEEPEVTYVYSSSVGVRVKETPEEVIKIIEEYNQKRLENISSVFPGLANLKRN